MKILAICNTYYQFISVLRIKTTLLKNDDMDLLISDHTKGLLSCIEKIQETKLFNNVSLFETKDITYNDRTAIETLKQIYCGVFGGADLTKSLADNFYDRMIFFKDELAISFLFADLIKINPDIKCARLEEGIISYGYDNLKNPYINEGGRYKIVEKARQCLRKRVMADVTDLLYCFLPELYEGSLKTVSIPKLDANDCEFKGLIAQIFEIEEGEIDYPQKYIFFASVGDLEGGEPIGELEIAKKVAEQVGYDNLIIKVHPRDVSERYKNAGFHIDTNSSLPWEVVQLNYNFSKHVFLTVTSSSVLTTNLNTENSVETYFLYPMCNAKGNPMIENNINILEKLINRDIVNILKKTEFHVIENERYLKDGEEDNE